MWVLVSFLLYALDVYSSNGIAGRFSGRVIGSNALNGNEFITLGQLSSGTGQFWQSNSGALSPSTISSDLLVGGTATSSALFQVFGSGSFAGTATTSGSISFTGATTSINQLNGYNLNFDTSPSGDYGLVSRMTILNNGNVGIGTTTPASKLHVAGNWNLGAGGFGGTAYDISLTRSAGTLTIPDLFGNGTNALVLAGKSNGTGIVAFGSGTNVGIGTNTPSTELDILGGSSAHFTFDNSGVTSGYSTRFIMDDTGLKIGDNSSSRDFRLQTNSLDRIVITGGGNVGIGTTAPGASLDVAGSATMSGNLTLYGASRAIQATSNNNLTIGGNSTGSIILDTTQNDGGDVVVRSSGSIGGQGALRFDQNGSNYYTMWTTGTGATGFGSNFNFGYDGSAGSNILMSLKGNGTLALGTATTLDQTGLFISKTLANAAILVNQSGSGDLLTASNSGATKFTLANSGAITDANYTTAGGVLFANSTGLFTQTGAGTASQCLIGGTTPTWATCATGSNGTNYWQLNSGALSPANSTNDLLLGGTATTSATFGFLNVAGGTPTATISSNLSLKVPTGANPAATFNILNGGSLNFQTAATLQGDGGLTSRLFIANNGNIGIGTAVPSTKLDILGGSSAHFTFDNSGVTSGYNTRFIMDDTGLKIGDNSSSRDFRLQTNSLDRIVIASGGNVGIGTNNPGGLLHVSGGDILLDNNSSLRIKDTSGNANAVLKVDASNNLQIFNGATSGVVQLGLSNASNTTGSIRFYTQSSIERMRLDANGNLGTGLWSLPDSPE